MAHGEQGPCQFQVSSHCATPLALLEARLVGRTGSATCTRGSPDQTMERKGAAHRHTHGPARGHSQGQLEGSARARESCGALAGTAPGLGSETQRIDDQGARLHDRQAQPSFASWAMQLQRQMQSLGVQRTGPCAVGEGAFARHSRRQETRSHAEQMRCESEKREKSRGTKWLVPQNPWSCEGRRLSPKSTLEREKGLRC